MKRVVLAAVTAVTIALLAGPAQAQFKGWGDAANKDSKTGRTNDGVKIDHEIDQLYRSRVGQKTPEVRSDPWSDVRTPATSPTPQETKKPTKAKN